MDPPEDPELLPEDGDELVPELDVSPEELPVPVSEVELPEPEDPDPMLPDVPLLEEPEVSELEGLAEDLRDFLCLRYVVDCSSVVEEEPLMSEPEEEPEPMVELPVPEDVDESPPVVPVDDPLIFPEEPIVSEEPVADPEPMDPVAEDPEPEAPVPDP